MIIAMLSSLAAFSPESPAVVLKVSGHSSEEWKRYLNVTPENLRALLDPLEKQDGEAVRNYGLEVMKQLTEALGYIWHEGMGLGFAAPIRFETESFQKKGFIN
jgi:hypothetical protein